MELGDHVAIEVKLLRCRGEAVELDANATVRQVAERRSEWLQDLEPGVKLILERLLGDSWVRELLPTRPGRRRLPRVSRRPVRLELTLPPELIWLHTERARYGLRVELIAG
jgi:hypothetical protein